VREVLGARGLTRKVFDLEGTSARLYVVRSRPVHYQEGGLWKDIDTRWEPSSRSGFSYEMTRAGYKAWVASSLTAQPFMLISRGGVEEKYTLGNVVWSSRGKKHKEKVSNLPAKSISRVVGSILEVPGFLLPEVTLQIIATAKAPVILCQVPDPKKLKKWSFDSQDEVPVLTVELVPYQSALLKVAANYLSESADGELYGQDSSYATARGTSYGSDITSGTARIGQNKSGGSIYYVFRTYLSFDTSGIADGDSVESATLYVTADTDLSSTDFLVKVYRFAWAEALNGASQEANYDGAYGGSATLEGTFRDTASGWSSGTKYSMSVAAGGINKTGDSKYTMVSSRDVDNTTPDGNQYVYVRTSEAAGTGDDPYLAIVVAPAAYVDIF